MNNSHRYIFTICAVTVSYKSSSSSFLLSFNVTFGISVYNTSNYFVQDF